MLPGRKGNVECIVEEGSYKLYGFVTSCSAEIRVCFLFLVCHIYSYICKNFPPFSLFSLVLYISVVVVMI